MLARLTLIFNILLSSYLCRAVDKFWKATSSLVTADKFSSYIITANLGSALPSTY